MYRLLQVAADNKTTGNLVFSEPDDALKWLFWAGLEIVSKSVDVITGWLHIEAVGRHEKRYKFWLVEIREDMERGEG